MDLLVLMDFLMFFFVLGIKCLEELLIVDDLEIFVKAGD